MAARHMRLWVPRITILAIWVIIHMIVTVRSVCLSDALSFYASDKACGFYRIDFADVFLRDSNKECLIKCSVDSRPSYEKMYSWKYKLTEMKINFVSTTHRRSVVLQKVCLSSFFSTNMEINITCKRQEKQNNRCDDDIQCADLSHSTCNKTSGLCQCVTGYYHLWETNTCITAQAIGESCNASIQCKAKTLYSICDIDKKCRCQLGYLEVNNSCSPGRQLNDTCTDSTQCSAATSNAICRSGVCGCAEGHLAISNTCINDKQCADLAHSTCNKTSGLCQCLTGYYHLWETNTCVTARGIGESCSSSLQCEAELPYSTCDTDKRCRCLLGYVELNKSCSLGELL